MINKRIFFGGLVVFLCGIVFGASFTIGTAISQDDYDKIDFSSYNFGLKEVKTENTGDKLLITFSCLVPVQDEKKEGFEIILQETTFSYDAEQYYQCRVLGDAKEACLIEAHDSIMQNIKVYKNNLRQEMEKMKSKESYWGEIGEDEDFVFTDDELNPEKADENVSD